jgi:hypothetical protein
MLGRKRAKKMRFKYYGIILLVGIGLGFGVGFKVFNRPEQLAAPSVATQDKTQEKKSGTITKYVQSPDCGAPVLASVETYKTDTKNDVTLKPDEKKNAVFYIPKYNLRDAKIYHSAAYTYDYYGVYLAENAELGAIFTFRW